MRALKSLIIMWVILVFTCCTADYKADYLTILSEQNTLNPFNTTPLVSLYEVELNEPASYELVIKGRHGDKSNIKHISKVTSVSHKIEIMGLYADYNNQITITFFGADGSSLTKELWIQTPKLDLLLPAITIKTNKYTDQVVLTTIEWRNLDGTYPIICDNFGDIRWIFDSNKRLLMPFEVGSDNKFIYGDKNSGDFFRMSKMGEIIEQSRIPNEFVNIHHEIVELPWGNLLVAVSKKPRLESQIVEVNFNGEFVKYWDLDEIFLRYIPENDKTVVDVTKPWCHNNSLYYDTTDNSIIVSSRAGVGVSKIDYQTGNIKWIFADPNKPLYKIEALQKLTLTPVGSDYTPPLGQHAVKRLPNGLLSMFDNGYDGYNRYGSENGLIDGGREFSRYVEYEIDESARTISQVRSWGEKRGADFYSMLLGDADLIDKNGHTLIVSGLIEDAQNNRVNGTVVEIDQNNEVWLEIHLGSPTPDDLYYRAERVNLY